MFRKSSQPRNTATPMAGGCLSLFGLPFFVVGVFISFLYFSGFVQWWVAQRWEETPCRIESAELKKSNDSGSTSYKATAVYHYHYQGRDYRGDRVSFGSGSDNIGTFQHDAQRELSTYAKDPSARPFRCYVNPSAPGESVLYRTLRWQMQAFMAVFALTFPAVGAGLIAGGILGIRGKKAESRLRDAHPDERWKWKAAWIGPSIPEDGSLKQQALSFYMIWFWLVVIPLLVSVLMTDTFTKNPSSALLVIFLVFGIAPTWFALKSIRRRLAVGKTSLVMKTLPASPGRTLQGSIVTERPLPSCGSAQASIECVKTITRGSGENSSITTEKVWSHQELIRLDNLPRDITGSRLPFSFTLPTDAPESLLDSSDGIAYAWKLQLQVPGTPIRSVYEIPVFHTAANPAMLESEVPVPSILEVTTADLTSLLSSRKIQSSFDTNGFPQSIICPPARYFSMILFLTLFNLVWTAAAVTLVMQHAPLIFRLVWPLSATAIWCSIIWMALHKRSVAFDGNGLVITHQFALVMWNRSFVKKDIVGFSYNTNMSSGNQSFYRVRLESVIGKKQTLVDGITESNTATSLVTQFERWRKHQV